MTTLPRQIAHDHCPVYEPGKGGGCKCGAPVTGQAHQEHVVEVTEAAVRERIAAEVIDVRRTDGEIKGRAESVKRRHVDAALHDAALRVLSNEHAEDEYPAGWLGIARGEVTR